ncbi:reverse transcriptase domain-containing protein [Tanacetum coccineum]
MAKEDEEKTAFITSQGIFCYSKMPFGLKNAGATYQRLVDKSFQKKIGRNLEVYVDDLVIKSRTEQEIMRDIEETFRTLREINMKLDPKNAPSGWRKACSWDTSCIQMKKLIAELPTLTVPMEKEELIVYLAAAREAISALLMTEREAKQMPVYFVSRAPQGPEINYTPLEKLVLALVHSWPDTYSEGTNYTYTLRFRFDATNNEAEYEALLSALRIAKQMGMIQYLEKVKTLANSFKKFSIKQVPKSENKKADSLSKIASTKFVHLTKQVPVEELNEKSINEAEVLAVVKEEGDTWMTPIYEFLTEETLPAEKEKARAVRRKSRWDNPFKDWCEKLCIRQRFASVKHPQANGLVERANRSLGEGIKARLDERSKDWIEEVPHVLWAHCTMVKSSNGDTSFSLTYGTEAVIPAEIGMPTNDYGNPPREGLHPSWEVFDETKAKVWLSQNPRSPSLPRLSRQGKDHGLQNDEGRYIMKYISEDYDEEREMEPRPEPNREATPTLRLRSPVVRR